MSTSKATAQMRALTLMGTLMLPLLGIYSDPSGQASPVLPSEERADTNALKKASVSISRFHDGSRAEFWANLQRSADPAVRAYLIDLLPVHSIPVQAVISQISTTADAGELTVNRFLGPM